MVGQLVGAGWLLGWRVRRCESWLVVCVRACGGNVRLAPSVRITIVTITAMTTLSAVRAIPTALRNLVFVDCIDSPISKLRNPRSVSARQAVGALAASRTALRDGEPAAERNHG